MVSFIKQEAEEKANEISVSAEEVQIHYLYFSAAVVFASIRAELFRVKLGSPGL